MRTAAAPHPPLRTVVASHPPSPWVQRQKIISPTIHHSMPPAIPVTTALVRRSVPVGSHTQPPAGPVAGFVRPSRPGAPNIRPRAPPATAPEIFHINRKGDDDHWLESGNHFFDKWTSPRFTLIEEKQASI
ncbi:hypothetical protein Tco_0210382 [Tanacetum coccineum]